MTRLTGRGAGPARLGARKLVKAGLFMPASAADTAGGMSRRLSSGWSAPSQWDASAWASG